MNETATLEQTSELAELAGQYLTFKLADEVYGLGILTVREIIGLMPITAMPRTPEYVRGVINLRGKIIPVIDLRSKFGMPPTEDTPQTCVIVVDAVHEVRDVTAEQIDERPHLGAGASADFILAIGKVGQSVVMLLDIDRVLSEQELTGLEPIA